MKITYKKEVISLPNGHALTKAILVLARACEKGERVNDAVPTRNDIRLIWREINDSHKAVLAEIARFGSRRQSQLVAALRIDSQGLRGVLNGLTRICNRIDAENPIRVIGYNASNRQYFIDADVAATIQTLQRQTSSHA